MDTEHRSGGGRDPSDIGTIPRGRCAGDALDNARGEGNYPEDIGHSVETNSSTISLHVEPNILHLSLLFLTRQNLEQSLHSASLS